MGNYYANNREIKEYAASTKQMSQMGRLDMKRSRSLDSVVVTEEEK